MQANYDYAVNDRTPDTMPSQKASPAREKGTKSDAEVVIFYFYMLRARPHGRQIGQRQGFVGIVKEGVLHRGH
jgi:hypothetical protein